MSEEQRHSEKDFVEPEQGTPSKDYAKEDLDFLFGILKRKDRVVVIRLNSGAREDDWNLTGIDFENGEVTVEKLSPDDPKVMMSKSVSIKKFIEWQNNQ